MSQVPVLSPFGVATQTIPAAMVPRGRAILFLVDQLCELGGGERTVFQLARLLPRHGFRVFVVTFRDRPDPEAPRLCDNIVVFALQSVFSFRALQVAYRLGAMIRHENIEIVQTFFESADTYGAVVARLAGVPHIISSRRDLGILRTGKHSRAYRFLARHYTAVLAVSHQVQEWHQRADCLQPHQLQVIHNGLSLERFKAISPLAQSRIRSSLGLPAVGSLVVTVANINHWKGLDLFLQAASLTLRRHPATVFVIAGAFTDPGLVEELRAQACTLGINRRVHFLGQVADVAPLLLSSDIFVLLSRTEGFPNVVLEAMAASLPVVASCVGGTPEAVEDGTTAFLVPPNDAEEAAIHLNHLLSDPNLCRRMGRAGRRRVESHFSLDRMIQQHVDLYHRLR